MEKNDLPLQDTQEKKKSDHADLVTSCFILLWKSQEKNQSALQL